MDKPILIWQGYVDPNLGRNSDGVYRIVGTPTDFDIEKEGKDRLGAAVWRVVPASVGHLGISIEDPDNMRGMLRQAVMAKALWTMTQAILGTIKMYPVTPSDAQS